jgi:hypothetical protein
MSPSRKRVREDHDEFNSPNANTEKRLEIVASTSGPLNSTPNVCQGGFLYHPWQLMEDPRALRGATHSLGQPTMTEQRQGNTLGDISLHVGSISRRQRHANDSNLCEECFCLDLEAIFSRTESELPSKVSWGWRLDCPVTSQGLQIASLGELLGRSSKFSCQLCRLLYDNRFPSNVTESYHLWAFLSMLSCGFINHWKVPRKLRDGSTVFLAVLPEFESSEQIPSAEKLQEHWESRGYIFRDIRSRTSPSGIWGRVIAQSVDFSVIREWLQFCKENHCGSCSRLKAHSKEATLGFRLIDCDTEEVISSSWTVRYAAFKLCLGCCRR